MLLEPQVKMSDPEPSLPAQVWSGGAYRFPVSLGDVLVQDEGKVGVAGVDDVVGGGVELELVVDGGGRVETVILLGTSQTR